MTPRLLLDTNALLWWLDNRSRLNAAARAAISAPGTAVFVSAASVWEATIKKMLGKLSIPDDLEGAIATSGFTGLPITLAHAVAIEALPLLHRDPFDRLLVAQARAEGLTLVTADAALTLYGIDVLMAAA